MNTTIKRRDPARAKGIHLRAGSVLLQAVGGVPKRLRPWAGVSERLGQSWCAGDAGSPLARAAELLASIAEAGGDAWPVLVALEAETAAAIMGVTREELEARLRRLMILETRAQNAMDLEQFALDTGDPVQLGQLYEAAVSHGARIKDIAAHALELKRRIEQERRGGGAS